MRARIIHVAATLATTVLAVGIAFGTKWGVGRLSAARARCASRPRPRAEVGCVAR